MSEDTSPAITAEPPESLFHTTGTDHITLVGSDEKDTTEFYRDVLRMALVLRQPNLDNPDATHLFFDSGDGRIVTLSSTTASPIDWHGRRLLTEDLEGPPASASQPLLYVHVQVG